MILNREGTRIIDPRPTPRTIVGSAQSWGPSWVPRSRGGGFAPPRSLSTYCPFVSQKEQPHNLTELCALGFGSVWMHFLPEN